MFKKQQSHILGITIEILTWIGRDNTDGNIIIIIIYRLYGA